MQPKEKKHIFKGSNVKTQGQTGSSRLLDYQNEEIVEYEANQPVSQRSRN